MMAPDGRCKALDAAADGYVRSEAAVLILLQTAATCTQLQLSGGAGLLLLAGVAVNQDGRSSSLTAPHGPSQQAVLRAALGAGGLAPGSLSGLEMHGTGGCLLLSVALNRLWVLLFLNDK
jgi:acyl transferase domain-containing protein